MDCFYRVSYIYETDYCIWGKNSFTLIGISSWRLLISGPVAVLALVDASVGIVTLDAQLPCSGSTHAGTYMRLRSYNLR